MKNDTTYHKIDLDTLIYLMPKDWVITKNAIYRNGRAYEDGQEYYERSECESFTQMITRAIKSEVEHIK